MIHAAFAAAGIVTVLLGLILMGRWSLSDEPGWAFFTTQFCGQLAGCLSTGVLSPLRGRGYRHTFAIGFALIAFGLAALGLGNTSFCRGGTGGGMIGSIIVAFIGAVILVGITRLIKKA